MNKRRVLFIASTGGHLNELLQLSPMFNNYDFHLITEKTKSNSYCKKCEIYMCNKCEIIHSKLFKNHQLFIIGKDNEDVFTGFCKEEKHNDELEFYCKTHNQLCCAACLCKIKYEGIGQHKDCDICLIKEIKDENKLNENIRYLEDISKNLGQVINNLKLFEKINENRVKRLAKVSEKAFQEYRGLVSSG